MPTTMERMHQKMNNVENLIRAESDTEVRRTHLEKFNTLKQRIGNQSSDSSGNIWRTIKNFLDVNVRHSQALGRLLAEYEKESEQRRTQRQAMLSSPDFAPITELQRGGGQIPSNNSAVALMPQPVMQTYVGGQILSASQIRSLEAGWARGTIVAHVPVAPGPPTGQYGQYGPSQYSPPVQPGLPPPPPGGRNWASTQPEARQGPTHRTWPSDMTMAGHGGVEYENYWGPQTPFEARPSGESSRSSNYQSDWNNSDGSQSTYRSHRS